jgi:ribosomal protein S27AE
MAVTDALRKMDMLAFLKIQGKKKRRPCARCGAILVGQR